MCLPMIMLSYLLASAFVILICNQAVKYDIGTVRIQRPHKGPFYVSPKTIDELIENLGKWARLFITQAHNDCSFFHTNSQV